MVIERGVLAGRSERNGRSYVYNTDVDISGATESTPNIILEEDGTGEYAGVTIRSDVAIKLRVHVTTYHKETTAGDTWSPLFYDDSENEEIFDISGNTTTRFDLGATKWARVLLRVWPSTPGSGTASVYLYQGGAY